MTVPQLAGKHAYKSLVPLPVRAPRPSVVPRIAILCYPRWLVHEVLSSEATTPYAWSDRGDVHLLEAQHNQVALVGGFGVGAPAAAMLIEELGGHGIDTFVVVGMAGSIDPMLAPSTVVVCDRALRDEGVSHHYLPPGRFVSPSSTLTHRLHQHLEADQGPVTTGATWTTDAPYRETLEEVRQYHAEGIRTVEMEAAGVFAVCSVRGYHAAAAFVVSDHLSGSGWAGHFTAPDLRPQLRRVLSAARRLADSS